MKNEMNIKQFENKVRTEIFWQGFGSDNGSAEYSFEVSYRKFEKLAEKFGKEFVEVLHKVYNEKI